MREVDYQRCGFLVAIVLLLPVCASAVKLPDLFVYRPANSFSPLEVKQGEILTLDFMVSNNGTLCIPGPCPEQFGPAYGPWEEAVFIRNTQTAEHILLGTIPFTGVLNPHEVHEGLAYFQVPGDCPPGTYQVIVHGDYDPNDPNGRVSETDEENNREWLSASLTIVHEPVALYVDDDGPSDPKPNDPAVSDPCESGTLDHPFDSIQEAINASFDGDTVLVADGIYTGDGNRDIEFKGKAITVKSRSGPAYCIIDCNASEAHHNRHRGFSFYSDEGADSVLDGFTITNGYAPMELELYPPWGSYYVGGGIYCRMSSPTIVNCIIRGNAGWGSGLASEYWDSSPRIINCVFSDNKGSGLLSGWRGNFPHIVSCTFNGNEGGAIRCWVKVSLTNSILWDNGPEEIILEGDSSSVTVSYCDILGGWPGTGNIDADPCFAYPENGDYHLKSQGGRWDANEGQWTIDEVTSPCIDAGDPMSPVGPEPFPNGGIINMGAYGGTVEASKSYFGKAPCETVVAGDVNGDCEVDFEDFWLLALHWCEDNNP